MTSPNISEIEAQIGHPVGHRFVLDTEYRNGKPVSRFPANLSHIPNLIRKWLIAHGVEENKVWGASDYVLGNAYAGGAPYIAAMKRPNDPPKPKRRGFKGLDLNLLNESAKPDEKPAFDEDFSETKSDIDLEHALSDMRHQLMAYISHVLKNESEALHSKNNFLFNDVKNEILSDINNEINSTGARLESLVKLMINEHVEKNIPRRIEIRLPNGEIKSLPAEPRHAIFDDIVRLLSVGQHVYLVGPAGTGKTHLYGQVARALNFDLETQFFPLDQSLTKYDVKGFKGPTGEYVSTLLYRACKSGGLLCIDEIDMWAAPALGALNSLLANGFGTFGDEVVKVHSDFRCIVAANTYGRGADRQYVGRNPLDEASLDRFAFLECPYDSNLERQLFGETPWLTYVHKVRNALDELKLKHVVSMRAIRRGLDCLAAGFNANRTCEIALWRGLPPDSISKIKNLAGEFQIKNPEPKPIEPPPALSTNPTRTNYDWMYEALTILRKGHNTRLKVNAIKLYKEIYDCTLSDAKVIVEYWIANRVGGPLKSDDPKWLNECLLPDPASIKEAA